ncbi:hypothetical protein N7495_001791 [Penicillium taxi]|uniref:uncharacterized protein n=1 Tax=Penicillium taxi TaxID=168475 RepID=UPI002545452F|nr:uncharacterized protein N7495_001791 [Penicillium taxi]KAJ5909109.1 hypothetical protein N7495_001791 [Penicillium taxi]
MESQDGITVRPMRLKVLYTFDNENKTNCLARWPLVLDIQTAPLDENTIIGVIELKTCIQAIVSASPELVGHMGNDYTVYAFDYSESDTPLVGQGMLSWVLASAVDVPPQSKTMITGRVCKNPMGIFSKGAAHETLEVKLRLVPGRTAIQPQSLDSISNSSIPSGFDGQSWSNFVRQNPGLIDAYRRQQQDHGSSPVGQFGIERFHQILSEGSTPRDFSYGQTESVRSASPTHSYCAASTPGGLRTPQHHQHLQSVSGFPQNIDMIRPSSSISMRDCDLQAQPYKARKQSVQSGYASGGEDGGDMQPRKRAKVYQSGLDKSDMNIERQHNSLRVAASTAASVRIHRPTPVHPSINVGQSIEEPIRPPTPISRSAPPRRARLASSLLRESSVAGSGYSSPYEHDDIIHTDQTAQSPDDVRYQGVFEPPFNMPSSPPVVERRISSKSSPPKLPTHLHTDSGFMSGDVEDFMDDEAATPVDDRERTESQATTDERHSRSIRYTAQGSSPVSAVSPLMDNTHASMLVIGATDSNHMIPRKPVRPVSRPCSRQSTPKPLAPALAPAPMSQAEFDNMILATFPASDPVEPSHPPLQHAHTWCGPMSDIGFESSAPAPPVSTKRARKECSGKRAQQIAVRLNEAIQSGTVPPYCANCGCIETPTWRRAWLREVDTEQNAKDIMASEENTLFYELGKVETGQTVAKFRVFKKTITVTDTEWAQLLLCNPCGLWLYKAKRMRPENKWNGAAKVKKCPIRKRTTGGPLSTRTRSQVALGQTASSPAPTDASSVPTPQDHRDEVEDDDAQKDERREIKTEQPPNKRHRPNSAEPSRSIETAHIMQKPVVSLERAIQSSPMKKTVARDIDETLLTPKRVRRALFPSGPSNGPLTECINLAQSPRRSPRIADKRTHGKENHSTVDRDCFDDLFQSPSMDLNLSASPTPRRRNHRINVVQDLPHSFTGSPTRNRADLTPTRLSAKLLQHIQESPKSSKTSQSSQRKRSPKNGIASLREASLQSEENVPLDSMIIEMFNREHGENAWEKWLPEGLVSSPSDPIGDEDMYNAILSNPGLMQGSLPFEYGDEISDFPDSGFFSSDAFHSTDPSFKPQSTNGNPSTA